MPTSEASPRVATVPLTSRTASRTPASTRGASTTICGLRSRTQRRVVASQVWPSGHGASAQSAAVVSEVQALAPISIQSAATRPGIQPPEPAQPCSHSCKGGARFGTKRRGLRSSRLRRGAGMELQRLLGGLLAVTACGTVDPGAGSSGSTLSIREFSLPGAVVGRHYEDLAVVLETEGAHGPVQWSLPLLPSSLAWLSVEAGSGRLSGLPLELVAPAAAFVAQANDGRETARREFSLGVTCREGSRTPCGVPDPGARRCVAGSRVCLGATLGACEPDVGGPPYEADPTHCGATCSEVCSRTTANRCLGVCMCGSSGAPCGGATPACCPAPDGRPEGFACASLQSVQHCGSCQKTCPGTHPAAGAHVDAAMPPTCEGGRCGYACQFPWGNCSGGRCRLAT